MARRSAGLLALAYLAFVSLGLPDALIGVAWPSLRTTFDLAQGLLGLPIAITAAAYFVSGMLAGRLMQAVGIGTLLAASTALVAIGVFGYVAAPSFAFIVPAALIVGLGSGAIDAALNTHAARNFGPRHMSWLHAAYSAGAMAGPAILTAVLGAGGSWRLGYGIVGVLLAALVPPFVLVRRRWAEPPAGDPQVVDVQGTPAPVAVESPPVSGLGALRSRPVRLQMVLFFLYSGVEMAAGQWAYTLLLEDRGLSDTVAGAWVTAYWGGLLLGRLVLGYVAERIGQALLLRLATVGVFLSSVLFALPIPLASAAALPLLSFSLASIFPGLMSETPRRVGDDIAPHAVGFQVSAATVGIAVVPSLAGFFGERLGLGSIGWVIAGAALLLLVTHERLVAIADRREAR